MTVLTEQSLVKNDKMSKHPYLEYTIGGAFRH